MTLQMIGDALPKVADVDHDDIIVPCRECGTDVPYKSSVLAFFGNEKRIVVCDRCCEEAEIGSSRKRLIRHLYCPYRG